MGWYFYVAWAAIISQVIFLYHCWRNWRYAWIRSKKKRRWQQLKVALIVPCKGLESDFDRNIASFFNQDYSNYKLWFVVEAESDPAREQLRRLKEQWSQSSKAEDIRILVAGHSQACSQKIHNLLYCYERIGDAVDVLAFADSDACVRSDWLVNLVWPLRKPDSGAATGYRWIIPRDNNSASLVLSALNAKIAQLLGNPRFNLAWGGSMAIRVDTFREVGLDRIWPKAFSDDLSLSYAVKKAGKRVFFAPVSLAASYESTTWPELFEFARRQFLITRVSAPWTWRFGLVSSLYSVLGLWGGAGVAIYAAVAGIEHLVLFAAVPIMFFASHFLRAALRQKMAARLLAEHLSGMKLAAIVDILGSWLFSPLLLLFIVSSAFGRTITWRRIRYRLLGPTQTVILNNK
jgi:ceramide glucosyltransferase